MIGNLKGDDDVEMDQKMYRDGVVRIGRDGVGGKTSGISSPPTLSALVMPSIAGGGEDHAPAPGAPTSGEIDWTETKSSDQR